MVTQTARICKGACRGALLRGSPQVSTWPLAALLALCVVFGSTTLSPALAQQGAAEGEAVGNAVPAEPNGRSEAAGAADEAIPTTNLFRIFQDGGILMWPILVCSVVVVAFTLERLVILRRSRVIPRAFVDRFLKRLNEGKFDRESALQLCRANGSPLAKVFAHAVGKWGRPSVEVEQAVIDGGEREVNHLRKNLRILNGVATVAPLLGLLGTVVGMIKAFNVIAVHQGMGKPELLADGISTALLTTAAGLTVAIPAFIAYLFLISRVDRLVAEVDARAQEVVELISAEGLEQQPRRRRAAGQREAEPVASKAG